MLRRLLGFMICFFVRSFNKVMGCFFTCFRIRDDRRINTSQLIATSTPSTGVLISENNSSSLLSQEERDDSAFNHGVGFPGDLQGLKDEARFLKACGTLAGTPVEILKASEKLKASPSSDKDSEPSNFHSWLPNTSVEKLQLDVLPFDRPTPIKLCQKWGNNMDSFENTPSSCISKAQDTQDSVDYMEKSLTGNIHTADSSERNAASVSTLLATNTHRKDKSVRFESDTDLASYGNSSDDWHMKENKSPNNQSAYKPSPYPTPVKLFDEMQTPGTVYPASLDELRTGKAQVRSQYVYPTINPGDHVFRYKIIEERDFNLEEDSSKLSDSVRQAQNGTLTTPEKGLKKISNGNDDEVKSNLPSRLNPVSIIEEPSPISPKWWYGNGIPNTTTKYKEDQKVKWHATPFEKRLDKALFEENFISQRKLICGKPVEFDEIEESDTALSQL